MPENVNDAPRDIRMLADEQIRKNVEESRLAFQKASSLRSYFEKYEMPIRDSEEQIRAGAPKGRRWKAFLPECLKLVAEASSLHTQVKKREQAALAHIRNAVAGMKDLSDPKPPPGAIEALEKCIRLRAAEFECLDGVVQLSHQIINLPGNATPVQIYTLLEQRRKYMARVGTMLPEADELERSALGPGPEPADRVEEDEPEGELANRDGDDWLDGVQEEPEDVDVEAEAEEAKGDMTRKRKIREEAPDELDEAFALLEKQVAALKALTSEERAGAVQARQRAAALEKELREEVESLSSKRQGLVKELEGVRASMQELKEKVRSREEKLREEREMLAADRKKLEQEVADAYRERDEALVLISSLTRRLNTQGLDT